MIPVNELHRGLSRISRLVWTLSAVGIGAGVLTLGMEYRALSEIRRQRDQVKQVEERASAALASLRLQRELVIRDMVAHFVSSTHKDDRVAPQSPGHLEPFVEACKAELTRLDCDEAPREMALHSMAKAVTELARVHEVLEQHELTVRETEKALVHAWDVVDSALLKTRSVAQKLEGRHRLQHQLFLRKYRNAAGNQKAELALQYKDELTSVDLLRAFSVEMSELGLVAERLRWENRIDQLVSLKDNDVRQTLMRLFQTAGRMDKDVSKTFYIDLHSLQEAMFGIGAADDPDHQTLVVGQGGLFELRVQRLTLASEENNIRTATTAAQNHCLDAELELNNILGLALATNTMRSDTILNQSMRDALASGLIVLIIFVVLSLRIARLGKTTELELLTKNEELKEAMIRLEQAASTDKLTGLPNRAALLRRLEQRMRHQPQDGNIFAVLFFDFDRFKVVNDSLGHDVGDALLCDITAIFHRELREADMAARFGGDEFVVLLNDLTDEDDAHLTANRLLYAFARPHLLDGHTVVSTASIGLVTSVRAYDTAAEMIRDADVAMYQAKDAGRSQVAVFGQAMHDDAMDRLVLESELRSAIERDQLRLLYQPIVEMQSGQLAGFEALLRWEHPERGFVCPSDFVSIAEDTGLINDIGRWILHTASAQIADWNQKYGSIHPLSINVNVSKRQLLCDTFIDDILDCQRQHDHHARYVKLEITESIIVDEQADVVPRLAQLREYGYSIVMDDFGTGSSSLSALSDYPIDALKIDQSFIRPLDMDRSLLAIVDAIVSLADNLGISTVAEGIETLEVVSAIQSVDCTYGQGYFFSKPLSTEDAEAYIIDVHEQRNAA